MTDPLRILSLGGGTQSCALALMSAAGELPRLDHVVFADTQGELPETYEYLDYLRGVLVAAEIPLHVVTAGSLEAALLAAEPTTRNPTPPSHTIDNETGKQSRVSQYRCSFDFKRRMIDREVKRLCGGRGAWKRATVEQWIGFSLDEKNRMKQAEECRCGHKRLGMDREGRKTLRHAVDGCTKCDCTAFDPWQTNRWPLIELRMRREDTIRWFGRNGHPAPPRSACWFCPNSGNDRWAALRTDHPDLFERACVIDETIRDGGAFNRRGHQALTSTLYLHSSAIPLRDADLRTARQVIADDGQGSLFDETVLAADCEAGVCFT